MFDSFSQLAFVGPGGLEFIVVMLVLLIMFGAKDAPRILRKLNEIINQIRNTADGFKREVMYSDLKNETSIYEPPDHSDESGHGEDDGYDPEEDESVEAEPEPDMGNELPEDEDDDAQKS